PVLAPLARPASPIAPPPGRCSQPPGVQRLPSAPTIVHLLFGGLPTSMSSTTREHSTAGRQRRRTARYERAAAIAAVAGVAAALAPASITGQPVIDALQRALVAAVVTFIAAHGHRWSWFVAGAVAALPARGFGLLLIVLGLVAAVLS